MRTLARVFPVVVALLVAVAIGMYRYAKVWTPLQRRYLSSYVWSTVGLGSQGTYRLLQVVGRQESHLAIDEELVPVTLPSGDTTFVLTDAAIQTGARRVTWEDEPYDHAQLHAWFAHWIYRDRTLLDLTKPAVVGGLSVFLVGPVASGVTALARARALRPRCPPATSTEVMAPGTLRPHADGRDVMPVARERSRLTIPVPDATVRRDQRRVNRPRPFFE